MLRLTVIPFRTAPGAEYRTAAPRIGGRGRNPLNWAIWRVYIVRTLGCGSSRTGAGLARIPHVSAGAQCLQGLECSSSPTSGTCFHCSGACEPLNVYKSPLMGPCGPIFVGGRCGLAAPSFDVDSGVAGYTFMAGSVWNCMTCCDLEIKSSCSSRSAAGTPGKLSSCPCRLTDLLRPQTHRRQISHPGDACRGPAPPERPLGRAP
ncbi:hypothetical protein SRABI26_00439 [Arthrobacter sp. Bi26]|nr:hypothetical protein SRABI26_00439 [Arthrobacter sp. Bi26]